MSNEPPDYEEKLKKIIGSQKEDLEKRVFAAYNDKEEKESLFLEQGIDRNLLKAKAAVNEFGRDEKFKEQFEFYAKFIFGMVFTGFILIGASWFWHFIMPDEIFGYQIHWLSRERLDDCAKILTSGAFIALLTDHYKKRLGKDSNSSN